LIINKHKSFLLNYKDTEFVSILLFLFELLVNEFSRVVGGLGSVGKKTTLLQAEASASGSGLANVLFCV